MQVPVNETPITVKCMMQINLKRVINNLNYDNLPVFTDQRQETQSQSQTQKTAKNMTLISVLTPD